MLTFCNRLEIVSTLIVGLTTTVVMKMDTSYHKNFTEIYIYQYPLQLFIF